MRDNNFQPLRLQPTTPARLSKATPQDTTPQTLLLSPTYTMNTRGLIVSA